MTSFTFRLQPLVKLREAQRDECREQLAEAYRADHILATRQEALEHEIEGLRRVARDQSKPGTVEVDHLLQTHRYELMLNAQHQQLATQRAQIAEEIERRRQRLVEADQEVQVLEKLRERHVREFYWEQEKLQIRDMDELAQRQLRRSVEGDEP